MASFATQLKDRFLGLVERVAGCGRAGDKDVKEPTKLSTNVQRVEIRSRSGDPVVPGGSRPGVNASDI